MQGSLQNYWTKIKGTDRRPPQVKLDHVIWSTLGALFTIGALTLLTRWVRLPLLMAPFGASCVLAFAAPEAPLAQPRNILGGHLLTTVVGFGCLYLFGDHSYSVAFAVALSIALMLITQTTHPPAGANPIIVVTTHPAWSFVLAPVGLGALVIIICATIFNNLAKDRRYPQYW